MEVVNQLREAVRQDGLENALDRYYSVYRGTVVDNEDPEFRGRLKVSCVDAYGSEYLDDWALPMGIPSGGTTLWQIPSVGNTVWIQFEYGDVRFPVWSWGWFKDGSAPQSAKVDGNKIAATIWQSASGHRIVMDDKNGIVSIRNVSGDEIEMSKTGIAVKSNNIAVGGTVEKAVKGNTLTSLLSRLLTTISTATTVDGKPLNPATIQQLTQISTELQTVLSQKVTLE